MNAVLDLTRRIDQVNSEIHRLEYELLTCPRDRASQLLLGSAEKHRKDLEVQFSAALARTGRQICRYRIIGENATVAPWAFEASLAFQRLYSLVFSAVASGAPKNRANLSNEHEIASTFEVAYSFTGSFGLVLTLTNERLLLGETPVDETMIALRELIQLRDKDNIRIAADRLGLAPIRALYRWADVLSVHRFGAEFGWYRGNSILTSALVQYQDLRRIKEAISSTSEKHREEIVRVGVLISADVESGKIRFVSKNDEVIRATISPRDFPSTGFVVPSTLRATFLKESQRNFSTDQESTDYLLLDFEMLNAAGDEER